MNAAGQTAKTKTVKALLIAENPNGASYLAKRLLKHGCDCEFVTSLADARSRIEARDYDLVLSATRLRDGGAFPLMNRLEGSGATLFYFFPVEEGCWWLPALRFGTRCFGSSALRPSDFVPILDEVIDEIRIAAQAAEDSQLASRHGAAVPFLPRTSFGHESSPTGITRPEPVLVKRKAAG